MSNTNQHREWKALAGKVSAWNTPLFPIKHTTTDRKKGGHNGYE
mgnify:CR=1 FL=1